jgi:hypothetical protein
MWGGTSATSRAHDARQNRDAILRALYPDHVPARRAACVRIPTATVDRDTALVAVMPRADASMDPELVRLRQALFRKHSRNDQRIA